MTLILLTVTLAVTIITITTSDNAFARNERYASDATSQVAAVSNECLNPILDSNTIDNAVGVGNCGGTISQQDESGQASAPITSQTANPAIELQRATSTSPPQEPSPPPEPSPNSGTVLLSVSANCPGLPPNDPNCPGVDELSFAVSTNAVSPTEFTPDMSGEQTVTFAPPSTFEVRLTSGVEASVSTDAPCSEGVGPTITGNVPPAGETISCNIEVAIVVT